MVLEAESDKMGCSARALARDVNLFKDSEMAWFSLTALMR